MVCERLPQVTAIVPVREEKLAFPSAFTVSVPRPVPDVGLSVSHQEAVVMADHEVLHVIEILLLPPSLVKSSEVMLVLTVGVKERTYCEVSNVFSSTQEVSKSNGAQRNNVPASRRRGIWRNRFIALRGEWEIRIVRVICGSEETPFFV